MRLSWPRGAPSRMGSGLVGSELYQESGNPGSGLIPAHEVGKSSPLSHGKSLLKGPTPTPNHKTQEQDQISMVLLGT